jgi:hypothetical protein
MHLRGTKYVLPIEPEAFLFSISLYSHKAEVQQSCGKSREGIPALQEFTISTRTAHDIWHSPPSIWKKLRSDRRINPGGGVCTEKFYYACFFIDESDPLVCSQSELI